MGQREIDNDKQSPGWYWKYGLHDAEILSVCEREFEPDWRSSKPCRNCLEICLDSSNAVFDQNVRKIRLYNYKIKTPDIKIDTLEKPWWISDTLRQLPNNHWLLEIMIETARGKRKQFVVAFEYPEIERK